MIVSLRLQNVCQYEDAEVLFHQGMTGIIGRNGFGKSNLINMLYAGLTGDFSCNAGNKDLNIRHAVRDDKKAQSRITIVLRVGDSTATVTRVLRGGTTNLVIDNGAPIVGNTAVTVELMKLLHADTTLLADHVFVRQGEMYRGIFEGSEMTRLQALQQLFQTEWAATCHQALTKRISQLPDVSGEVDLQLAQERLDDAAAAFRTATKIVNDLGRRADLLEAEKLLVGGLRRYCRWRRAVPEYRKTIAAYKINKPKIANTVAELAAMPVVDTGKLQTRKHELSRLLDAWEEYEQDMEEYEDYSRRVVELSVETPQPTRPHDLDRADLQAQLQATNCQYERTILRNFNAKQQECPTCKRPVDTEFAAILAEMRDTVAANDVLRTQLEQQLDALRDYDARRQDWVVAETKRKQRLEDAKSHLTNRPVEPEISLTALNKELDIVVAKLKTRTDANAVRERTERTLATLKAEQRVRVQKLRKLAKTLRKWPKSRRELIPAVLQQLTSVRESMREHAAAAGRLDEADRNLQAAKRAHAALQRQRQQAATVTAQRERLDALRNCLHPQALPRLFAQRYMEELMVDINEMLKLFEATFTVGISDGLSMYAHHVDGTKDTVQRLSGGQKVVLSLGFRVAVYKRFAMHVGLLVLDEPTEWLDTDNIDGLCLALNKLRHLADSTGMQCIVITHEKRLQSIFDQLVVLENPGRMVMSTNQ